MDKDDKMTETPERLDAITVQILPGATVTPIGTDYAEIEAAIARHPAKGVRGSSKS